MSAGRSYTTSFNANTTGFKKGTEEMVEQLNKLNKSLVDNQYKQRECNSVINKAKKEIKDLYKIEQEKGQLDDEQKKKLQQLNETIEQEKVKLSQLRTEQVGIRQAISETSRAVTENNDKWTVLKGTLAHLSADVLKQLAAQIVSIGKDVIHTGEQFSASMSEVGAISGATADELKELEAAARLYGATTKFSATEAADALKYMALAGWDSQQAIAGLPAVLDLAAAAGMDLGRASDIVTDYITAFGLEVEDASRFVDIMSYAMSNSNTTAEMLGEAYKNCAATAKSMGFSVEETTSALMTMANAGVKGGEAGTTLNTLMTRLATNTKGCADELKKYGVEIYDSQGNMHSLSEIMNGLISAFETLTQQEQANLSKMIASTNQYAGFQTLMQGMSEKVKAAGMSFEDYTAALEQCEGTSNDMAKTMSNNLTGDIKTLQSALDELKLKLFDSAETPLRNLVKLATNGVVPAIEGIIENLKNIIPVIVGATAAMVSFKASIAISDIVSNLTKFIEKLTIAQAAETVQTKLAVLAWKELNAAQKANVIGLVVSLVIGLAGWLGTLLTVTQENTEAMEQANESAKDYTQTLKELNQQELDRLVKVEAEAQTLRALQSEYDTLRQKAELTKSEKSKLDSVAGELAKTLGITTQELKNQGGTYKDITRNIDEYIQKLREQVRFEMAKKKVEETTETYYQLQKEIEKATELLDKQRSRVQELHEQDKKLKDEGSRAYVDPEIIKKEETEFKRLSEELQNLESQYNYASNAMKQAEQDFNDLGKKLNGADDDLEDNAEITETAIQKTETLSEKYERLNGMLEENEQAIKDVNDEIEQAMDSGDEEHLKKLQDKLKDLNSENTTLKNRIKAVKDEIEKDANAIADAIENVENSMQMLQKAEKEVADNGKLSLNTLMSIQKKYPELIGLVNDYVSGVKTEKDVIAGLKEVYEKDVENYNQALAFKKLKQDSYNNEFANASAELINKYQEHYGIDLKNFMNVTEAKLAAQKRLQQAFDEAQQKRNDFQSNYMVFNNAYGTQYMKKDSNGNWKTATAAEIAEYKRQMQELNNVFDKAFLDMEHFDETAFQKQLEEDIARLYKPVNADGLFDLSGSSSSGKNDSEKKNPVTLSGNGVTATGDTYAKAYMTWVDRLKSLGKITEQGEIYYLEKLKERTDNSAEEIYQIDLKLYQARQKLAEENAKNLADIEKKNQDELQEKLNLAKAAYDRLVNGKIESLQKEAQAAKDTANAEIAALDAVMKKRNEEKENRKRQSEISKINERLKYNKNQLTDMEITDLYRRKQELIDEQNETDYQRMMEQKKADILANAENISFNVDNAISTLQKNLSDFTNHAAVLMRTQTAAQKVVNNNQQQNIQIVQNALSNDQLTQRILRELQKFLYT